MTEKLIELAKVSIISTNNFIHGIDHIVRVYEIALEIANEIENELTEVEMKALKLACYWHDIGRIDLQSYSGEYDHAENSAESLSVVAKRFDMQDSLVIKTAISAIRNHRSTNSKIDNNLKIDKILWDADKLDIFNTRRIIRIVNDYKKLGNNGEYTLNGSLEFWKSINEDFSDKFNFEISKKIFQREYPKFKELINKIIKENEVSE